MSGTIRLAFSGIPVARCQTGRSSKRLTPPPLPPTEGCSTLGRTPNEQSFHTPDEAIRLSGESVRFVPPTAVTQGEVEGNCTAADVPTGGPVNWKQPVDPASPVETKTPIPEETAVDIV